MGTHSIDPGSKADISERLKQEMQKLPHQTDAAGRRRRLHEHHATAGADGVVTDALLKELFSDHALMKKQQEHGTGVTAGTPQQRKNPTSWTHWCEKNRDTPEIVPGSGLVKAHFFMSGSACK